MDNQNTSLLINEVQALFTKAEHRIKIIEDRGVDRASIPSINQLRYAGRHLIDYMTKEQENDLLEASIHCKRALFDAYEAEILFYMKYFNNFLEQFNDIPVSDTINDYVKWVQIHSEVQQFLINNRQTDDRFIYFEKLDPYITSLSEIHNILPFATDELNKKRRRLDRGDNINRLSIALGVIGVIGVVITTLAWCYPDLIKDLRDKGGAEASSIEKKYLLLPNQ